MTCLWLMHIFYVEIKAYSVSADIFSRSHTCFKHQLSVLSINHFQVHPSKWVLRFISLSIRLVLFMLLVVAGDVERNPGPPKRRTSEGQEKELQSISCMTK